MCQGRLINQRMIGDKLSHGKLRSPIRWAGFREGPLSPNPSSQNTESSSGRSPLEKPVGLGCVGPSPALSLPHPPAKLSITLTLVLISWDSLGQEARNHFGHRPSQVWLSSRETDPLARDLLGEKGLCFLINSRRSAAEDGFHGQRSQ